MADATYQPKIQKSDGGNTMTFTDGSVLAIEAGAQVNIAAAETTDDAGAAGGSEVVAVENMAVTHRTVLTLDEEIIPITDHTTAGAQGSVDLYEFPAGNIHILGCTTNLTTLAGVGGVGDTAALVGSVGSAAVGTDNSTLTSLEANIVPSTSGTLVAGAGTIKGKSTGSLTLDGTSSNVTAYLNLAVPDAGSSADDTVTVSGTVTITWVNLGDN